MKDLHRHCEKHGDYEATFVTYKDKPIIERPCVKCMEDNEREWNKIKANEAAKTFRDSIERNIKNSGLPKRYTNVSFDNYICSCEDQSVSVDFIRSFAMTLENGNGSGMILCGNHGTGKTMLACCVANEVLKSGKKARYAITSEFLNDVKKTWCKDSEVSEDDVLKPMRNADLLILDEIGVQFDTEAEKVILFRLLNHRYNEQKSTILVSNKEVDAVKEFMTDRVCDRILEGGGAWIPFTWESYRKEGKR